MQLITREELKATLDRHQDVKLVMGSKIYYAAVLAYYLRRLSRLGLDRGVDDVAPNTFEAIDVDLARDYRPSRREK